MTGDATRELAYRQGPDFEVALLWHPGGDLLTILVVDTIEDECFVLVPEPGRVLDVFNHPFAHAPLRGAGEHTDPDPPLAA